MENAGNIEKLRVFEERVEEVGAFLWNDDMFELSFLAVQSPLAPYLRVDNVSSWSHSFS